MSTTRVMTSGEVLARPVVKPSMLFYRPGPWQSAVDSSTKILCRQFMLEGYTAHYCGVHPDIISLLRHPLKSLATWRQERTSSSSPELLRAVSPWPMRDFTPFNSRASINRSFQWTIPSLTRKIPPPDIIWAARPGASALKALFPRAKLVMQVVDYYPAFRGEYVKQLEREDYAAADHIFLIGEAMQAYLTSELGVPEEKLTVLGQGVFNDHYAEPVKKAHEFESVRGPIGIWVGVTDKADTQLMRQAASTLHELGGTLALIGPQGRNSRLLQKEFSNVLVLGPRAPQTIPTYLCHADLGIMLYDSGRPSVYSGQNPLKLYEYAAAGLPVISTAHDEYDFLDAPVRICGSAQDVDREVRSALIESGSGRAKTFASAHDWSKVFHRAQHVIDVLPRNSIE